MSTFNFTHKIVFGVTTVAELDCEYRSNGPNDNPTIRVFGCEWKQRWHGGYDNAHHNPKTGDWTICGARDFDRGEDGYETLLATAEGHGQESVEADNAWVEEARRYDREMARAAE